MTPLVVGGSAHPQLTQQLAQALGTVVHPMEVEVFPDGERTVFLREAVTGCEVVVVQPTQQPAGEHLLELCLMCDALRRGGARRITAVVPYLAYARQDRRETGREPLGARVVAEILASARIDQLICVDLHSRAVEGCFLEPVSHVSAAPLLAERLKNFTGNSVVVSPDLGGLKRAEAIARPLGIPVAVVHKQRLSGDAVEARGIVGDVKGRHAVLVDDIISTGGTLVAAAQAVIAAGAQPRITVAASHGLFAGPALERLATLPLERVLVTDSVPPPKSTPFPLEVVPLSKALVEALNR